MTVPADLRDPVATRAGRLLTYGTIVSIVLIGLGLLLMLVAGIEPVSAPFVQPTPSRIVADLLALRPAGFIWAGLVLTVSLPTARVVVAALGYWRIRDRRAALVAIGVLAVLLVAFAVAVETR